MRPRVGVVADDITGAGDIGGLFAKHGYAVRVFGAEADLATLPRLLEGRRHDVLVVDTDSRFLSPELARERVARAARALQDLGCTLLWKKTCSVFRGNVGAEFDALLDALGAGFGAAVAAFPKNGRTTLHGVHYVRGVPLNESEFKDDPVHPTRTANLLEVVAAQSRRPVRSLPLEALREGRAEEVLEAARRQGGYLLCDCQTQQDLHALARLLHAEPVLLGSSALAEELPHFWEAPEPFDPLAGVDLGPAHNALVVAASVMPQTRAQVEAFVAAGGAELVLSGEEALAHPERARAALAGQAVRHLRRGQDVLVRSENYPEAVRRTRERGEALGLGGLEVSRRVSGLLAEVAREALAHTAVRRLVVLGGDTSASVCRALGIHQTVVLREIQPGLPSSLAVLEKPLLLVLKSGSFGQPDFILRALEHLENLRSSHD
ncbi:four-carbon acid sugar kinase family protein [Calidithermus chliarophilus]|uniref:four-carbon acid sugar kinase family protein n=1 Tax=Calidithermus chliarophilus TaxID=52023 RepID=UPI00047F962D|nr:four-carbon acid sugar kinase family protein [Calidithermus chliarophilus]